MGNTLPVPDERLAQTIELLKLTKRDITRFWKIFRKLDHERIGVMQLQEFYELIGEERSLFGDALFEGGNDEAILHYIDRWPKDKPCPVQATRVSGWEDTRDHLKRLGFI